MNVKLLRQIGQRLLTPYGSQGHLRFESRRVVPAWSSAHRFSCSAAILAAVRQKLHLSNLFKNPEPALTAPIPRSFEIASKRITTEQDHEELRHLHDPRPHRPHHPTQQRHKGYDRRELPPEKQGRRRGGRPPLQRGHDLRRESPPLRRGTLR